ncbi:VOC family protein [Bacillus ndiopicus]|uniref:VOC family protein n=1 Tax=Bacillus ndiopicus TaxID=1347368 RepID=UPI0005A7F3AD|nr:VOC family protein [Bacillus ndiopicus]
MFKVGGIFIPVTNLERSKKWYELNLGVTKVEEWQENGEDHGVGYVFQGDTVGLALIKVEKPQPTEFIINKKSKNVYYNFVVDQIEPVLDMLKQNGVETTDIHDYGLMKGFDFFDPDGNSFSVVSEDVNSPYYRGN